MYQKSVLNFRPGDEDQSLCNLTDKPLDFLTYLMYCF